MKETEKKKKKVDERNTLGEITNSLILEITNQDIKARSQD